MLLINDRVRPCNARFSRSSSGRVTLSVPSWFVTEIVAAIVRLRVPLGPFTVMFCPEPVGTIVMSTPVGTVMGACPIRDIAVTSPDVAEDFAADFALARFAVGHESLRGGQDGNAEAPEHARHIAGLAVHTETGRRDAAQARDRAIPVRAVLHLDRQDVAHALGRGGHFVALDVALLLEDLGECDL